MFQSGGGFDDDEVELQNHQQQNDEGNSTSSEGWAPHLYTSSRSKEQEELLNFYGNQLSTDMENYHYGKQQDEIMGA